MLKTGVPINITSELKEIFDSANKVVHDACKLALKQPIPGKQLVILTDSLIKRQCWSKNIVEAEKVHPRGVWLKKFLPRATQNVHMLERFFGTLYDSLWDFSSLHTSSRPLGGSKANNCSDRQQMRHTFFPNEGNSASTLDGMWLWVAICFQISTHCWFSQHCGLLSLQTGTQSHGGDTSQNPGRYPNNTYRSDHLFLGSCWWRTNFPQTSRQLRWVKTLKPWAKRRNAMQWVANEEPSSLKISMKWFTKIDLNTTSYSMKRIKANARIRVEQDVDLVLKNMKPKNLGPEHDDVFIMTNSRYKHYKANEDRILLQAGPLFTKYFGETRSDKYYQNLIPKQLVKEVLRSLHGETGKHPRIDKTLFGYRENNIFQKWRN